ncbi:uncharacterized protein LOC129770413 [Toxorhynchites rutilus septentrionalis]|uniref:uncharacterized protein LOC129770413 n=1 Tax=Toxorhynchites rutilus septentrionalis TaxID=329112 RepID=UPI0024789D19|nr:uncharacterized protein LOC129770413 [Toxorhynchites rutilus septentrionalis]
MSKLACMLVLAVTFRLVDGSCEVNINDLADPEPVFLKSNNELWAPVNGTLQWSETDRTLIACPGSTIDGTNLEVASIECVCGTTFRIQGSTIDIRRVVCQRRTDSIVWRKTAPQNCAVDGTLFNIGFDIPTVGKIPLIEVCYDMRLAAPIYSHHEIRGTAIGSKIKSFTRPRSFKSDMTPPEVDPSNLFTIRSSFATLTNLLGSETQAKKFMPHNSSRLRLSRGHLAPDADGIFRSWRLATYYYLNVVPQWQICNAENWERVESIARKMAKNMQEDLMIYTGSSGVLNLPDSKKKLIPFYLTTVKESEGTVSKIPVPSLMWKVLKSRKQNAAIAFVQHNNPFLDEATISDRLCDDSTHCAQYGFVNGQFKNVTRGYTYCCTVDELSSKLPSLIPSEARAAKVLCGPK